MKRVLLFAILGGIIGIVAGYYLFGEIGGVRVTVEQLLTFGSGAGLGGALRRAAQDLVGIDTVRRNILLTGAVTAAVAGITAMLTGAGGRRKRRR